jgi:hypothetical protein
MRSALLLVALILLAACAARPTREQLATADPGPFPDNYQELTRATFEYVLFDPFSAQYRFNAPEKGWASNSRDGIRYGWHISGLVNAKNRMGGYVGWRPFNVVIRNGRVIWSSISNR